MPASLRRRRHLLIAWSLRWWDRPCLADTATRRRLLDLLLSTAFKRVRGVSPQQHRAAGSRR